jgi:pimeloyl-[acyl-carrier protein] methyl ester esterase
MNISEIHLYHGWGFNSELWKPWIRPAGFNRHFLFDRGYTGNPFEPREFREDSVHRFLISHSFGLHFIPENVIRQAGIIIILSGFECFHTSDVTASQKKMLKMIGRFREIPLTVMADFYTNCMYPDQRLLSSPAKLDIDLLGKDLELLNGTSLKTIEALREKSVLLFHGKEDIIVTPDAARHLHRKLPGSRLIEIGRAGHMIPSTHMDLILRNLPVLQR